MVKESKFFDSQKEFYTKAISLQNNYKSQVKNIQNLSEIINLIKSEFKENYYTI